MLIRRLTPGAFTFILPATRETPRLLVHPKKRTVGIRIPDYTICQRQIETLNRPLLAISARLDGTEYGDPSAGDREMFLSRLKHLLTLKIDVQQPLYVVMTKIV